MLNFILNTNIESFKRYFSMPQVWVAMFLCIVGVALVLLARRITRVIKDTNNIADNDKTLVTIKCIGITMLVLTMVIIIFIN